MTDQERLAEIRARHAKWGTTEWLKETDASGAKADTDWLIERVEALEGGLSDVVDHHARYMIHKGDDGANAECLKRARKLLS